MGIRLSKCLLAALLLASGLLATSTLARASTSEVPASIGFDISYPQCGGALPSSAGFGIVGVNDGYPLSTNPCLASELRWAQSTLNGAPSFYMNTASPGPAYSSHWPLGQQSPQLCDGSNSTACSYDYGWNDALASFNNAVSAESSNGSTSPTSAAKAANWWLDVETANSWETLEQNYGSTVTSDANDQATLQGSMAYFSSIGISSLGIYSTASQWTAITGGTGSTFAAVPVWTPGYATLSAAQSACLTTSFTGGRVAMIQYPSNGLDGDFLCGLVSTPAVGSVTATGSPNFTEQLVASGNNGTVAYAQTSGLPELSVSAGGLVTTNGALTAGLYTAAGTTSDPNGDEGTFAFTLSVGVIAQSEPPSGSVTATGSPSFTEQLVTSGNNGTVTYVQTSGLPDLSVSAGGLVTTNGALAVGTYSATGTTSDPNGDEGMFAFTLTVSPTVTVPITVIPHATKVIGHAVAGRTVVLLIAGSGFFGQPLFTSHAGTRALVTKDTGSLLTVRVKVKRGSRNGTFTFTVTFAKGESLRVTYVQR